MTPIFKCLICRRDIERSTKTFWIKKGHLLCSTCLDDIEKNSSRREINRNDLIEKLQKTDEDLPIETHVSDLVDEMKIFRISPGTYLNLNDAIKLSRLAMFFLAISNAGP